MFTIDKKVMYMDNVLYVHVLVAYGVTNKHTNRQQIYRQTRLTDKHTDTQIHYLSDTEDIYHALI